MHITARLTGQLENEEINLQTNYTILLRIENTARLLDGRNCE